ncbi:hypothetical protein L2E82_50462 [Cichorium intybus]|nr:hypothetical protein L2E82_50462 [Cichorium intybus]
MMVCAGLFLTAYSFIFRVGRKILSNESVSETNYNMEEVEATMVEVNFNRSIPISKHENTSSITKLCEWSEKEFWIAVCFVAYIALTVCDFGNSLLVLFYGCQSPISFLEMKTKRNLGEFVKLLLQSINCMDLDDTLYLVSVGLTIGVLRSTIDRNLEGALTNQHTVATEIISTVVGFLLTITNTVLTTLGAIEETSEVSQLLLHDFESLLMVNWESD